MRSVGTTTAGSRQNKEETLMKPIRVGGENVFPDEVEGVLCYHPAIAAAAVVGMPDGRNGEVLVALVAPKPGQTAPSTGGGAAVLDRSPQRDSRCHTTS